MTGIILKSGKSCKDLLKYEEADDFVVIAAALLRPC